MIQSSVVACPTMIALVHWPRQAERVRPRHLRLACLWLALLERSVIPRRERPDELLDFRVARLSGLRLGRGLGLGLGLHDERMTSV